MTAAVLLASIATAWGGNVTFKAKLDSATLLMGKTTTLHLEITQDKDARGFFPGEQLDTLNAMVEIAERPAADTTDLGNNRIQINRDLIIQSFDSGMWIIKPIPYVVNGDTAFCNQLTLKVLPVDGWTGCPTTGGHGCWAYCSSVPASGPIASTTKRASTR